MPTALVRFALAGLALLAVAIWAALAIWLQQPLQSGTRTGATAPLTVHTQLPAPLPAQADPIQPPPAQADLQPPAPADSPVPPAAAQANPVPTPPAEPDPVPPPPTGAGSRPAPFPPTTGLGVRRAVDMDAALGYTEQSLQQYWGKYLPTHFSWINERGGTPTGCGTLNQAQGMDAAAFYCPKDQVIYLDSTFLLKVDATYGLNGVQAVVAHEYGHHIEKMTQELGGSDRQDELKADYYAGQFMAWLAQADPAMNEPALERQFASLGDPSASPSNAPGAHGYGADRVRAFASGWHREPFGSGLGQLSPSTTATA